MTTAAPPRSSRIPLVAPRPRRWTKAEYYALWDLGWFADQRVELLDGEILEMPNPGPSHCTSTDNVAEALRALFPKESHWVRMQMPLDLGLDIEPQPDVAVAAGAKASFGEHPKTAVLVVEVSDSTLAIDRGRKASLYACAGIADYWIVNLIDRQVEVHRAPVADATADHGFGYRDVTIFPANQSVVPLAAPQASVPVASLLP